jgi:predicted glutamine amidotransferase
MCGLIGVAIADKNSWFTSAKLGLFAETAALIGTTRGQDGTGIALVKKPNEPAGVYKEGIPGWNFLDTRVWTSVKSNLYGASALLLHTRKATTGTPRYSNTHPFSRGPVTLEHNGTLRAYPKRFDTDSEYLCEAIAKSADVPTTLAGTDGAYALAWHDARNGTVNLARNSERPLVVMTSEKEGIVMWASEEWMLDACASRIGFTIDLACVVEDLPVGELRSISLGDKLKVTSKQFTPKAVVHDWSQYQNGGHYDSYKNPPTVATTETSTSLKALPSPLISLPEGWALGKEIHFCAEEVKKTSAAGSVNISGAVLEDTGGYVEATAFMRPASAWRKYDGMEEPVFKGKIIGHHTRSYSPNSKSAERFLVVSIGDPVFVGTYKDVEHLFYEDGPAVDGEVLYEGPWGEKIVAKDICDFLEDGCVNCQAPLYLKDVEDGKVTWSIDGFPLCSACSSTATITA